MYAKQVNVINGVLDKEKQSVLEVKATSHLLAQG